VETEHVVPVLEGWAETFDGGSAGDHFASHGLACGIGIEAAVDFLSTEGIKPGRVGPGPGSGHAAVDRVKGEATYGVDGGLSLNDGRRGARADAEEAEVLSGTGRHPAPGASGRAAQFGSDGLICVAAK